MKNLFQNCLFYWKLNTCTDLYIFHKIESHLAYSFAEWNKGLNKKVKNSKTDKVKNNKTDRNVSSSHKDPRK